MGKKIRVWDGSAWQDVSVALPYNAVHSAQASMPSTAVDGQIWLDTDGTLAGQDFVPLTGGTMTGNLNTPSINSGPIVGRNKIINGDFSIWQRGTSFTLSTGAVTFTADRFFMVMPGGTAVTRQAFTPGEAPVAGYDGKYYIRTVINTNAQNYESGFRIEDVRTLSGQTATLSFWARSTIGAAPLGYAIFQNFGTGGSPSAMVQATQLTGSGPYTPTSTWQRYSYTFSIPSISGKTLGTDDNSYLLVRPFQFTTTATNTSVDLWGVQLEAGSIATPYHNATPNQQTELAACHRYYYRLGGDQTYQLLSYGPAHSTTRAYVPIRFPVTMRTVPSSIDWSTLALQRDPSQSIYSVTSLANLNNNGSGKDVFGLDVTIGSASLSAGTPYILMTNGSTSAYLGFSAEL